MSTECDRRLEVFLNAGLGIDFIFNNTEHGVVYFGFDSLIPYYNATNKFAAEWLNVRGVIVELVLVRGKSDWQVFFNLGTLQAKLKLQFDQVKLVSWWDYSACARFGGVYGTKGESRPIAAIGWLDPDAIPSLLDNAPNAIEEYALILLKDSRYGQDQYVLASFHGYVPYARTVNTVQQTFCIQHPDRCKSTS